MKTILIATDFSKASRNASLYGIRLAQNIGAKIILFNAYAVPFPPSGLGVTVSRYTVMMETDKLLLEEAEILDPKATMIEILCDEGVPEDAIINIAKEKNVDLIISGMKGSGKTLKKLFGSTATALAQHSPIPLIIVPEKAEYFKPGIMVFATDKINSEKEIPDYLISIVRLFGSKLYVVQVIKNEKERLTKINSEAPKKIVQIMRSSFEYVVDDDISRALNKIIIKRKADMLIMMPHEHNWMERLISKSQTEKMIFHTSIPLLILPEVKTKRQKFNVGKLEKEKIY
jgi:nucleotide-binding universal stress UspA family protein